MVVPKGRMDVPQVMKRVENEGPVWDKLISAFWIEA